MATHISQKEEKIERIKLLFRGKRMKIADLEEKNKRLMKIIENDALDKSKRNSVLQDNANLPTASVKILEKSNESQSMTHSLPQAAPSSCHLPNNSHSSASHPLGQTRDANSWVSAEENHRLCVNNGNTSQSKQISNHRRTSHELYQNRTPSGHNHGVQLNDQRNHTAVTNYSSIRGSAVQQSISTIPSKDLASHRYHHPHQIHGIANNYWNSPTPPPYHHPHNRYPTSVQAHPLVADSCFQQSLVHQSQSSIHHPPQSTFPHHSNSAFYSHPQQQYRHPHPYPHSYHSFRNSFHSYNAGSVHKDFAEFLNQKFLMSYLDTQKNNLETGNNQQLCHNFETSSSLQSSVNCIQPSKSLQDNSSITNQRHEEIMNIRKEGTRNALPQLCDLLKLPPRSVNEKEHEAFPPENHTSTQVLEHLVKQNSLSVSEFTTEIMGESVSSLTENSTFVKYDNNNHNTDPRTITSPNSSITNFSSQTSCPMPMVLSPPLTPPTSTVNHPRISLTSHQSQALLPNNSSESLLAMQMDELSNKNSLGLQNQNDSVDNSKTGNSMSLAHSENSAKNIYETGPIPSPPEVVICDDQPSSSYGFGDPDNSVETSPVSQASLCAKPLNLASFSSSSIPDSLSSHTLNLTIQPKSSHHIPTSLSKSEYPQEAHTDCAKEFSADHKKSQKSIVSSNSSDASNMQSPFYKEKSDTQPQMTSSSTSQICVSHECDNSMVESLLLPSTSNSVVSPVLSVGKPSNVYVPKTSVPNSSVITLSSNSTTNSMSAVLGTNDFAASFPCTEDPSKSVNHSISEVTGSSPQINDSISKMHADKNCKVESNGEHYEINSNEHHTEIKMKPIFIDSKSITYPENLNICCYACGSDNVKGSDMEFHLFFGMLKCENCDSRIEKCQDLKGMKMPDMMCSQNKYHKFSVWVLNPIDFLSYNLWQAQRKNRNAQNKSSMHNLGHYLEALKPLKNIEPWDSALSKCTRFAQVTSDSNESASSDNCENSSENIKNPSHKNDDEAPELTLVNSLSFKQTADRNETEVPKSSKELSQVSKTESSKNTADALLNVDHLPVRKKSYFPVANIAAGTTLLDSENNVIIERIIPNSDGNFSRYSKTMMEDIPESAVVNNASEEADSEFVMKDTCSFKLLEEVTEYVHVQDVINQPVSKANDVAEQSNIKEREIDDNRGESHVLVSIDEKEGSVLDKGNLNSREKNQEDLSLNDSEIKNKARTPHSSQTVHLALQNQLLQENHLIIPLKTDREMGILSMDQVPEECPLCYTALCPSRFTMNVRNYEMTTKCCDCNLIISLTYEEVTPFESDKTSYKRPGPKSKTIDSAMKKQKFKN